MSLMLIKWVARRVNGLDSLTAVWSHSLCRMVCFALQIIVANPKTAGVARWIFLALWGSKMKKGDAAALEYVTKVRLACVHGCMDACRDGSTHARMATPHLPPSQLLALPGNLLSCYECTSAKHNVWRSTSRCP